MKKVVFCEIAWMKEYCGVTENDKPMNGGKYIEENGEGGEIFNFAPHNHLCYGYVMHYGAELHIERYDKVLKNHSEIGDMTVVWVASDGKGCKIVGWYEHATMYRFWQVKVDNKYSDYPQWDYNFIAKEEDTYLIPEKMRSFVVPRAPQAGKGRGMGQSQVWYADSAYAQEEFIPCVLEYLDSVREKCIPTYFTKEEISELAEDKGASTEELIEQAKQDFNNLEYLGTLQLANLAVAKEDNYTTRKFRADVYDAMAYYDEAEEEYKMALYHKPDDLEVMYNLMNAAFMLEHAYLVIELGQKIHNRRAEPECKNYWKDAAMCLFYWNLQEGNLDAADILLQEYEKEKDIYDFTNLEELHEHLAQVREDMKNRV